MAQDDARVAQIARALVQALDELDAQGGDHALIVDQRRRDLVAAVKAEQEPQS